MPRTVQGDFFADMLSKMERRSPFGGHFVPPRRFTLNDHVLYVAELNPRFMGGSIAGGTLSRQILCIALLEDDAPDSFPASRYCRSSICPARFYWLGCDLTLQRAIVSRRGNTQESLSLTAYTSSGRFGRVSIHRILGVTFRCSPMLWQDRFRSVVEVDHLRGGHGNNLVLNLRCKWKEDHRRQPRAIRWG